MYTSTQIDQYIEQLIYKEDKDKSDNHVSSGKLSASMLGQPYQWMVLKYLGIKVQFDNYTLRKFERGRNVEQWLIDRYTNNVVEKQKLLDYKNCIGYLDILGKVNPFKDELLPIEIKSVSNAKYKRILKENRPDRSHKLQAGLYGLAINAPESSICYIATDDYRITHYVFETKEVKDEIDTTIKTYHQYIERKEIPEFEAIEKWQASEQYNSYSNWMLMDKKELAERAKKLYEQATSGR